MFARKRNEGFAVIFKTVTDTSIGTSPSIDPQKTIYHTLEVSLLFPIQQALSVWMALLFLVSYFNCMDMHGSLFEGNN